MEVGRFRYALDYGYSILELEIDGKVARIPYEQKGFYDGIIFLGADFEDGYQAILPADPADGRPRDRVMKGFTDDPRVLAIYTEFRKRTGDPGFGEDDAWHTWESTEGTEG